MRSERRRGRRQVAVTVLATGLQFLLLPQTEPVVFHSLNHHVMEDCNSNMKYFYDVLIPLEGPG